MIKIYKASVAAAESVEASAGALQAIRLGIGGQVCSGVREGVTYRLSSHPERGYRDQRNQDEKQSIFRKVLAFLIAPKSVQKVNHVGFSIQSSLKRRDRRSVCS